MNGYMPPEWAMHEASLVEWPVKSSLVHPENYENVCRVYKEVIETIARFEPVYVVLNPGEDVTFEEPASYEIHKVYIPHDDAWARDNGPTYVYQEGHRFGVDWKFNAWGEKYTPYDQDDKMASEFMKSLNHPFESIDMVMEGGSIHVDGQGTLMSTKECLLNPNRNPELTQFEIEDRLKSILGIERFLWLENGLSGDETDGHIDNIACFADVGKVMIQTCHEPSDPNYAISQSALAVLKNFRNGEDLSLEIIEIESPPCCEYEGDRLTLSYLNFYFVNGGILLPVFGGEASDHDMKAKAMLEVRFPDREIVPINTLELIKEGGNIHCITQQIPVRHAKS